MPTKKSPTRTPLPTLIARQDAQVNEDEESRDIESNDIPRSSDLSSPIMVTTPPKSPVEYLEPNDNGNLSSNKDVNTVGTGGTQTVVNSVNSDSRISLSPSCNGPSRKMNRSADTANHSELEFKELREPFWYDQKTASPQTETKIFFALHPSKTQGMKLLPHPLLQDPPKPKAKRRTNASGLTPENPPPQKRRKRGRPRQHQGKGLEETIPPSLETNKTPQELRRS
ncbi:hypothetical protein F4680DRAFT_450874 [Xylaria scruposa]|nr:hypothetical protein F4680DRAFT_450874 [Xylaria scruposa]